MQKKQITGVYMKAKNLKVNGYRLYGDAELVIVEPPIDLANTELTKYLSVPKTAIELNANNCRFNKGSQSKKDLSIFAYDGKPISVTFTSYQNEKYEGLFLLSWLTIKGKVSFSAIACGAYTFTPNLGLAK